MKKPTISLGRLSLWIWFLTLLIQIVIFIWNYSQIIKQQQQQQFSYSDPLLHQPLTTTTTKTSGLCNDNNKNDKKSFTTSTTKSSTNIDYFRTKQPQLPVTSNLIRSFHTTLHNNDNNSNQTISFPCFPAESTWNELHTQQSPTRKGFLYVKARKTGSSTIASVAIRIAKNMAQRKWNNNNLMTMTTTTNNSSQTTATTTSICNVRFNHPMASKLRYGNRIKNQSFLWTVVRQPTRRFISEFFHFAVSRDFIQPSDLNMKKYMVETKPRIDNYYLRWFTMDTSIAKSSQPIPTENIPTIVESIMTEYNFIGISERLDESMVTLQFLLNLTTFDILYFNSKVNGGYDDGVYRNTCYYIIPSFVSSTMQDYFINDKSWYNFTVGDNLLYKAVNASLDATIATFDSIHFQSQLQQYKWALQKVQEACQQNVTFPCSANGQRNVQNDCLVWDSACGMDCIDRSARQLKL